MAKKKWVKKEAPKVEEKKPLPTKRKTSSDMMKNMYGKKD